jgi:hypothetical protein
VKVPIAMRFEIVRNCLKQEADQSKPPFGALIVLRGSGITLLASAR